MDEAHTVEQTLGNPATVESISHDLIQLGVKPGIVLLVHASMSSLGWVSGGSVAIILALENVLGPHGTLMMPTHSGDLSDPANWQNPPVPKGWWKTIRETMPPYDPNLTPTRMMGRIAETFRKQQGVLRSDHPQVSFAAWGAEAQRVTAGHELDFGLGEGSPLARIYDLDGWVLMLGVGYENNTSLHLAEGRSSFPEKKVITSGAPIFKDGQRDWVEIMDLYLDDSDFLELSERFEREKGCVRRGKVAQAQCRLMPQRDLVDYAVQWMEKNRR
ncbi:MAG: AAC(3) family N-acetyltransferase [Chloroflexi bacterium RBG_16_48_8]|nr:MAG: AAC(3) family N-acetyltransferase [Chloroflexi bacterium RBG_16_48_8]